MNPDPSLELPAILPHEMNVRVVRKGGLFWVWVNNIPVTVGFDARDPQPYIEPDGVSKSLMLELSNFNSGASPVARSRISGLKIKPLQDEPTLLSIPATLTLRLRYFLRDSVKEGFITFSETGELSLSATNVLDAQLSVVQPEGLGDFSNPPEYTFPNYWIPAEFRNAPWRVNPEDFEIFFDKPDESESTWRGMDFSGVGFAAGQWVGMEVARTIRYHWPNTISGTSSGRSIRISIRRKDSGLMVLTNARIVVEVWDTT